MKIKTQKCRDYYSDHAKHAYVEGLVFKHAYRCPGKVHHHYWKTAGTVVLANSVYIVEECHWCMEDRLRGVGGHEDSIS